MFREEGHYREQRTHLPTRGDIPIVQQFGFLPNSILKPEKKAKLNWKNVFLNDDVLDFRKKGGYAKDGVQKMSEFNPALAENIVRYWSLPGARVVDPFSGRATRSVVTSKLGRKYYGYDISPSTHKRVVEHCEKVGVDATHYLADGTLLEHTPNEFADFIYTCPPYFNIEKYEKVDGQLSEINNYDSFISKIDVCAENCYRVAKPGTFCVWVVADFRHKSHLVDFHGDVKRAFTKAGYDYHDIIILENISPFAAFKLYQCACLRYTPKTHEYIMVFRKPGEYEIPDYCYVGEDISSETSKKFFEF